MVYRFLRFPGGKSKAVTFSYDDLFRGDLRLAQTFSAHGLKGTFNINSSTLGREKHLSPEEVREYILDRGHEVAVHGKAHRGNGAQRPIEGIRDALDGRLELEETFGRIIRGFAYPDMGLGLMCNGGDREEIKTYLRQLDLVYARSARSQGENFALPEDWMDWHPTAHHKDPKLFEKVRKFLDMEVDSLYRSSRYPRLLFIWGHSFEFDRDGNWDLLEEICRTLGGQKDLWYATNIEIFEYVQAFRRLVFSADGRRIYNPTLMKLWFDVDGKGYGIEPGETLVL